MSEIITKYNQEEINIEQERKKSKSLANKYTVDKWFENISPII
jgi:hypothetical protein